MRLFKETGNDCYNTYEKERHRKKAKMGQNEGQRPKNEKREKNHDFFGFTAFIFQHL